jgi:hypothetical protein
MLMRGTATLNREEIARRFESLKTRPSIGGGGIQRGRRFLMSCCDHSAGAIVICQKTADSARVR